MRFPHCVIESERLLLRPLEKEDLPLYYSRLWSRESIARYMLWQPHKTLEESAASMEKARRRFLSGEALRLGIALRESDQLIGIIDLLRFDESDNSCSFAYMIAEDFWGQSYGTEAVLAAIGYAFDVLDVSVITADHFADNPASGAVMRKAGMTWQRTLPARYEKDGVLHDAQEYRITKEQWNRQKER